MSTAAKRIATRLKVLGLLGVVVLVVAAWLIFRPPSFDNATVVPVPTGEMNAATVAQLARASEAQGVCYGWRLGTGYSWGTGGANVGSNLGATVAVDSDPVRCPRWVEVRANVRWTSSSSESPDSATVTIASSGVTAPTVSQLARFGLDNSAFVDEPDWAVCQAALALPLLVAERGAVPAVPVATSGATAPGPAPDAGSDFWRDRWTYIAGAAALLALGVLAIGIGWFEHKHERTRARRPRATPPPVRAAPRK
ncbi:hypothetical protein [Phytohabitans kaempferiae]|uniref:Uncharacterized protein n=1 Tax=Phytohabitans kaempferiae TaxID=1620943 RepID=A0ABV6LYN6_9ACTN